MKITHIAFGIPVISEIPLPAFLEYSGNSIIEPIEVTKGEVPTRLQSLALVTESFVIFNESEFLHTIPEIARYYVQKGNKIIIEPLSDNWTEVLLFFYSNCLAAALFQRNMIPFHVSGIFLDKNRVLLFAAPSGTGKSTTAVMLQEQGYAPFTDDTAVLSVENGKCYAQASYPMIRLWQNSIANQDVLEEQHKQLIRTDIEIDKYGFYFHDEFVTDKVEVAGIVFLEEEGDQIQINTNEFSLALQYLDMNIYRNQWLSGMRKHSLKFKHLTDIINTVPTWKATRPEGLNTFDTFAHSIERQIIHSFES